MPHPNSRHANNDFNMAKATADNYHIGAVQIVQGNDETSLHSDALVYALLAIDTRLEALTNVIKTYSSYVSSD